MAYEDFMTDEDLVRCVMINLLVLIYSPWEWCLGFAVFKGIMHRHAYWGTWERTALTVVVFVLGQRLLPIALNLMLFGGGVLIEWVTDFTVSKMVLFVSDYTLWPTASATWVVLQYIMPIFSHLVFVPFIIPRIIERSLEEAMCLRLRMDANEAWRMRHEMQDLKEQAEKHNDALAAKDTIISTLRMNLKQQDDTNALQSAEIKRLAQENKRHLELQDQRLADLRHELTAKSDACKADLHARINLLNEELAQRREDRMMYEKNAQAIKALHERKAGEMEGRINRFAQTLQSIEVLYHKLTTKLRLTEVGAAIAFLEHSIRQYEGETQRLADRVRSLEDQKTKAERQHKAAMDKMQAELKQKEDQLAEQSKKARIVDPNAHLNRCDKQLLLKLARSQEFAWHFRTFLQSPDFEHFIKGYMKLEVQHQHLFRWMMSVINEAMIDDFVHRTFGKDRALLSTMTTGIIEPTLLSTPRRVELTKKNTNAVLLAIHPDKLATAPAWLCTLRERMFKAFQDARCVLG